MKGFLKRMARTVAWNESVRMKLDCWIAFSQFSTEWTLVMGYGAGLL